MTENPITNVVSIKLNDDFSEAYIRVSDFSLPPAKLLEIIKILMQKQQIRFGLQKDSIKQLMKEKKPDKYYLLAKGIPPSPPVPPGFQMLIKIDDTPHLVTEESGRVDHKKRIRSDVVEAGQQLARIIPGKPGKPGKDVRGEIIPPLQPDNHSAVQLGEGVSYSEADPLLLIATRAGVVKLLPGPQIMVDHVLKIEGDVDFETGNIDFPGDVHVTGDLKSGFSIKAAGSVRVDGTVEDAKIEAGKDITVGRGFTGTMKGLLKARHDVTVGFAHNQVIEAGHNVNFEIEMIGCQVTAGNVVESKSGRVVGGRIKSPHAIDIRLAGSEEEVRTELHTGQRAILQKEKEELERKKMEIEQKQETFKNTIYELVMKKIERPLTDEEKSLMSEAQSKKDVLANEAREIDTLLAEIEGKLKLLGNAFVKIKGVIYPNVEIIIGSQIWVCREKRRRIVVRQSENRLKIMPA